MTEYIALCPGPCVVLISELVVKSRVAVGVRTLQPARQVTNNNDAIDRLFWR